MTAVWGQIWYAKHKYKTYQQQKGHSGLETYQTGLIISKDNHWLADDRVKDPSTSEILGLVEYKNPYSVRDKSINEAYKCKKKKTTMKSITCLKKQYDYVLLSSTILVSVPTPFA